MRASTLGLFAGIAAVVISGLVACSSGAPDDGASATANVSSAPSTVNVLSSKNDINRTGHNAAETYLTTANVTSSTFGRLFSRTIDGNAYAQPLYASNVGGKNLVFIATEHNTVYAFDADDTSANAGPIWSKNLGPSLPSSQTGCGLLSPEIGITGTPVIDLQAQTMWFTSRHFENGKAVHKLNALDIATGNPRPGSPVVITANANGTGSTSVGGVITFDPLKQMQRPGLLKVGNEIIIGFGSQCDSGPYHGWLMGYDATTLQQNRVHITTPNGGEGSIWNGGVGINADEKGDIYFPAADAYASGSGTSWNGADNEADSLVRLHDDGSKWVVVSKFTTFDAPTYSPQDRSFGNGGGILIPGSNLYLSGDKRGQVFVVDRDNMGGMVTSDANVVQKWQAAKDLGTPGGGAYFQTGSSGIYYTWGTGDTLKAWKFDGEKFSTAALTNATSATGYPGGALSISSNASAPGTSILWSVKAKHTSSGLSASEGAGALVAFDAFDVTKVLYSSDEVSSDQLGNATKFAPPTIANGKVFVGTSSNQLVVYGLKAGNPTPPTPPVDAGPAPTPDAGPDPVPDAGPSTATWSTIYADLFGPNTPGHCGNSGCHATIKGGFLCGATADTCYTGMVNAGFLTPSDPTHSPIIDPNNSPLAWFNGGMPMDDSDPNDAAAAELTAWIQAGAPK